MEATQSITTCQQGESTFNGYHDDFCYVCGGTMELFGCKTCSSCCHVSCMRPSVDPNEMPPFWYCPYCVDRELNIARPASPSAALINPLVEVSQMYPSQSSIENSQNQTVSVVNLENTTSQIVPSYQQQPDAHAKEGAKLSRKQNLKTIDVTQTSLVGPPKTKTAGMQPKTSFSPPQKRSKYSNLSSEIDKALVVIQKELEKAAKVGKLEDVLQDRICDLEQQLKLKDGQIRLAQRKLELARDSGSLSGSLEAELESLKVRNAALWIEA